MQIGYCGNVHPGRTIDEVKRNLIEYSLAVKKKFRPDEAMGIGLWLSATAARELEAPGQLDRFREWLGDVGLVPFTFNGFPFGDFHQPVVKHDVYLPTWGDRSRLDYTLALAEIQHALLPPNLDATISTLPLGWPGQPANSKNDRAFFEICGEHLRACARRLNRIEQDSGRNLFICIEPEPGCLIDTWEDLTEFFQHYLLTGDEVEDEKTLHHIGVCHDICHSAVMFENQLDAIAAYRNAGIRVGKIQVSSAIKLDFNGKTGQEKTAMVEQLRSFAEPKYLHQTSVRNDARTEFFEDLPLALSQAGDHPTGQWRVHFHVPIYSESLDQIETTQSEIADCLASIKAGDRTTHFEVETYAWNVLPDRLKTDSLAEGIARELKWFEDLAGRTGIVSRDVR